MDILIGSTSPQATQITTVSSPELVRLSEGSLLKATVQRVVDSMVWLEINGRILSARTEIPLQAQQPVLLEVIQADPAQVTLRLVNQEAIIQTDGDSGLPGNLQTLLNAWGMDADDLNLTIAKALLTHSQTIHPEDIQAIRTLWQSNSLVSVLEGRVPPETLEALVYLYVNELPINDESLALADHWLNTPLSRGPSAQLAQGVAELQTAMSTAVTELQSTTAANPALKQLLTTLESALNQIANWPITADMPVEEMATRLAELVSTLNTPAEAELAHTLRSQGNLSTSQPTGNPPANNADVAPSRPGAANIQSNSMTEAGSLPAASSPGRDAAEPITHPWPAPSHDLTNPLHRLASAIAKVLADPLLGEAERTTQVLGKLTSQLEAVAKDLGAIQLFNLTNIPDPDDEPYYLFPIPLAMPEGPQTAHLKVYRRPGSRTVDPANVRLALLLDLPELGEIAINLNLLQKRLTGQILSAREHTHQRVESQLDTLFHRLNDLGYWVNSLTCDRLVSHEARSFTTDEKLDKRVNIPLSQINVRA
ncbi:MAG: flagellar hook-length control protein FliK [Chloroflexota bacterium]